MSWLALWLLTIAVMDLVRPVVPRDDGARPPAIGAGVLVVLTALTGMIRVADMLVLASLAPMAGWWWFSERSPGLART